MKKFDESTYRNKMAFSCCTYILTFVFLGLSFVAIIDNRLTWFYFFAALGISTLILTWWVSDDVRQLKVLRELQNNYQRKHEEK